MSSSNTVRPLTRIDSYDCGCGYCGSVRGWPNAPDKVSSPSSKPLADTEHNLLPSLQGEQWLPRWLGILD